MAKKRVTNELSVVFGPEPKFEGVKVTKKNYNSVLIPALQWYSQFGGANDNNSLRAYHKSWIEEWALANGFKKGSFTIPNQGIATMGAAARVALRGFPLNKDHIKRLKEQIKEWLPVEKKEIDYEANARLLKIKARNAYEEAVKPFLTEFDTTIDSILEGAKKWKLDVSGELNATQAKDLTAQYKRDLAEIEEAKAAPADSEIAEAYPYSKLVMNRLIKVHNEILEVIKEAGSRGKMMRRAKTPRKKKVKPASAHIKKLQYMTVHDGFNLASVDPETIVGATVLYAFDTNKRLLKKYTSGVSGIEVSGTTLKNCVGVQKKIRKPEDQLAGFATLARTKAEKLFSDIKAVEKECTGRTNKDTILLKVF